MASDAPNDPPPADAPTTSAADEAAPAEVVVLDAPPPPPPPVAVEPVSPAKEWLAAVLLMIVFAFIAAQFVSFLRNN